MRFRHVIPSPATLVPLRRCGNGARSRVTSTFTRPGPILSLQGSFNDSGLRKWLFVLKMVHVLLACWHLQQAHGILAAELKFEWLEPMIAT